MRIVLLMTVLLGPGLSSMACPWDMRFVSSSAKPLSPVALAGISSAMPIAEIVRRLGPAARDVGSGLHQLQWDVAGGRIFYVATATACGKPFEIGFGLANPDDTLEPKPLDGNF